MDPTPACPNCRTPTPPDSPGGACPRCLMALAFATDAGAPPPDVAVEEVQRRFPAYDVLGTIGRGGMGVVFRARQRALDREVALKVLPVYGEAAGDRGPSRPAGFTERFEREARALARLQHPGIVQVFDFGSSADGWCFLAMEYVDGVNLRHVLGDRRLAPKEALAIVPQICDALQYAHDHGVVHRDIKPENVLLAKDGRVKLADFGLAKLVADARGAPAGPDLTHTGHSMGTPVYMAPEQIERPGDVDHRADIYSLGVVFYEMLTGELPIGRFAAPSKMSDVDARIDEIVLRTLEKERAARFQRADEVRTKIDAASGPMPPPLPATPTMPAPAEPSAPAPPARVSKLAVLCAITPLAAALIVALVWGANSGSDLDKKVTYSIVWAGPLSFIACVTSLVAWGRIRHSGGAKFGRLFAALGFLAPVAAAVAGAALSARDEMASLDRRGIRSYVFDGFATDTASLSVAAAGDPNVDMVSTLIDHYFAAERGDLEGALALYAPNERKRIQAIPAATRVARGDAGLLGLPLAPEAFLGAPPELLRIAAMRFEGSEGSVSLRSGDVTVTAPVGRVTDSETGRVQWFFHALPVRREMHGTGTAKPKPTIGSLDAEILAANATIDRLRNGERRQDDDPEVLAARQNLAALQAQRDLLLLNRAAPASVGGTSPGPEDPDVVRPPK